MWTKSNHPADRFTPAPLLAFGQEGKRLCYKPKTQKNLHLRKKLFRFVLQTNLYCNFSCSAIKLLSHVQEFRKTNVSALFQRWNN